MMKKFEERKFNIPAELKGISQKTTEEHLKLYAGYVKNANGILEKVPEYQGYTEADAFAPYVVGELARRFSFEFNGMRNHEVYFASFEGGPKALAAESPLRSAIAEKWGDFDAWLAKFKSIAATTRGIGWMVLWCDPVSKNLLDSWVDEQHIGQLQNCTMILGLDMWEHSYVADYQPSGKKQYIEDFFANINWEVIEKNYIEASK
jgi:Fe-Mn family superoxide dismutase